MVKMQNAECPQVAEPNASITLSPVMITEEDVVMGVSDSVSDKCNL